MAQKVDLIAKKRDGHEFTQEEIRYLIQCVTDGDLEQCQLGKYS